MKHNYLFFQRYAWMCILALLLVAITTNPSHAQHQPTGLEAGVFRIKVTEELFTQLEHSRMTKNAGNVLVTGIKSIDRASLQHKVTGMKRVFRQAGKFEARHRRYGLHRWFEVKLDKAASVTAALSTFKGIEQIEIAEAVHKKAIIGSDQKDFGPRVVDIKEMATLSAAPNDPLFAQQWHYNNNGQAGGTAGSDISILQAWGIETGSSNVIVAVTDGGAQVDHPDLAANMWINTGEIADNNIDDDNNGYVDDINGYGFGDNTGEIAPHDHGTHTSGTIAATANNAIGVAGVAGGSGVGDGVRIMTCAAFGGFGVGGFEDTYVYGADNGAVISQNSWGYTVPGEFDQVVLDAIDYFIAEAGKDNNGNQVGPMKGGIVIFAAGNSDSNEQNYPGFYEATLAVGAVNNQDKKAWYSSFGEWVDMSAPGGETFVNNDPKGVLSTIAGGQYAFFQGTSMACPHVSGVAGLIISKFGGVGFTPEMLRGRLTQLVDNIDALDPDFTGLLGTGRLNAFSALQENDNDAPDAIDSLAVSAVGITTVTLTWTSPVDPGYGSATLYDIRYSTAVITDGNFNSASAVTNQPVPKPSGTLETFTVTDLMPATTYYFAVKTVDFFSNFSAISNIVEQATNAAPAIEVLPTSLTANLQTADTTHQTLTLTNNGKGTLNFMFVQQNRLATPLYVTGFEEFARGEIGDQQGWEGSQSWTVEKLNNFEGTKHFRGRADGLGFSFSLSPIVAVGSEPISSTAMHLNVKGKGVTWGIIPLSSTEDVTEFKIARDGGLSARVASDGGFFAPINATLPDGYFELRIDVVRATQDFTIYIDGESVFTGHGFAGEIEQVAITSKMEHEGPTLDIDNFAIYNGRREAPWVSVNPESGTIPAGSSATVTVTFNASDLEPGVYTDSLRISSNDPEHSPLFVPVVLSVNDHAPPVLQEISDTAVIELGSLNVTFTASDEDGEAVTVVLDESLSFVTLVSAADGTATYSIQPKLGDAGEYHLPVIATDERGAIGTAVFHLTVIPYGVENFSLVYFKSGIVKATFEDSLVIDVSMVDLEKLTIRANTNPAKIGSVKFWVDDAAATLENILPYDLNHNILFDLSGGEHTIKADAFTKTRARGDQGKSKEAIIHMINTRAITGFAIQKYNYLPVGFHDGEIIDISVSEFEKINIMARIEPSGAKSVVFELNGEVYRIDNKSPHFLSGQSPGKDFPWNPEPGMYTLKATPYSKYNGQGIAGISGTINFEVRNGSAPSPAIARSGEPTDEGATEENAEASWSIYPIPVLDKLHLKLSGKAEGEVGVMISNMQGATIFKDQGNAHVFRDYTISTVQLGLSSGVYLVQIKHANGKRVTRKFIKQ